MDFCLNLFSIRTEVDTHEKFLETAHKLKGMGYSELQCSACPLHQFQKKFKTNMA